jgi:hypothetical protein
MATVAGRSNWYVLDRLGKGTARVILDVAGRTLLRGSFENAIGVAGLTTHGLVRPSELKAGGHVVKRGARLLRVRQTGEKTKQKGKRHQGHGPQRHNRQVTAGKYRISCLEQQVAHAMQSANGVQP